MSKKYFFCSFALIAAFSFWFSLSAAAVAPGGSTQFNYQANYDACVKVYDSGRQLSGQRTVRFYNGCPRKLYVNACVTDVSGKTKLYQSGRSIQTNANYTIYSDPFYDIQNIEWAVDPVTPAIPNSCKGKEKGSSSFSKPF